MNGPWDLAARVAQEPDLSEVVGQGLTLRDWVTAGVTLAGFIVAGRLLRVAVTRLVDRADGDVALGRMFGKIAQNIVILVGFTYALNVLEVQIGPLLGALGLSGIAVALALTAILENLIASVVLKTRRPIVRGDEVSSVDHRGFVEEINFRTVILRNYNGEKVVIPSSMLMGDVIVNHTTNGPARTVLPVGVAYGTDLAAAQATIIDAVKTVDDVHDYPAPDAWVTTFGDSSIDFDVRFWHAPDIRTRMRVRSDAAMSIKSAFDAAGIEIPFPQRVVTMVPTGDDPAGSVDADGDVEQRDGHRDPSSDSGLRGGSD